MHSFLYFRRAGGSHVSTLFYACNMQKRENKAIFLRISEEMAKKRRNMQPTAKRNGSMQGFVPRKHPSQACSQPCRQYSYAKHSAAAGKLTSASAGNNLLPSIFFFAEQISAFKYPTTFIPARPVNTHPPPIFLYRHSHNFPSSNTQQQPADVICRLPIHSLLHFFSFDFCKYFSFFKKRRNFLRRQLLYCLFFCISEIDFIEYRIYEFLA